MSNLSSRQYLQITKIIDFPDYSTLPMGTFMEEKKKSPLGLSSDKAQLFHLVAKECPRANLLALHTGL